MCACINYTDSLITRNTLDRQREVLREILAIEIDGRKGEHHGHDVSIV